MNIKNLFILIFVIPFYSYSQDSAFVPSGKPFATIFANFHQGITGSAKDEAAFELVRGYLGYEYNFSPEFYAKINVDVGSPNDLSPYSKARRYAYFKNAYLRYMQKGLTIDFGLIDMRQFKLQEAIWERRYLMKTLADEYQLGQSANLGVNLNYKFTSWLDADFTISNGEGYSSIQMDDVFKYGSAPNHYAAKNFTSRVFYEFTKKKLPKPHSPCLHHTITKKYGMLPAKWFCATTTSGRKTIIYMVGQFMQNTTSQKSTSFLHVTTV